MTQGVRKTHLPEGEGVKGAKMTRLRERALPVAVAVASAPLLFSFQLVSPPDSFRGLPFAVLWSWGVLGAIALPVLLVIQIVSSRFWGRNTVTFWPHGAVIALGLTAPCG